MLIHPRSRHRPAWPFVIDRSHPLAQGLVCCPVMGDDGRMVDLVQGQLGATTATRLTGPHGASGIDWTMANALTAALAFTSGAWSVGAFFSVRVVPANGEYPAVFGRNAYTSESINSGWGLSLRPSDGAPNAGKFNFYIFANNSFGPPGYAVGSTTSWAAGEWAFLNQSDGSGGTTRRFYLNGRLESSVTTGSRSPGSTSAALVNTSATTAKIPLYIGYGWSRTLSAAEALWLSAEPWAMVETEFRHRFYSIPVAPSAYDPVQPWSQRAPILAQ
jgi:hypothetical protein